MGYPPQYPPQYYAPPQQPQYVTEDEVAQIVENAINEKLRQVLPQVLPQVFKQTIDRVNTLEREVRELRQRVDELAREINEIMRVVPDINRILPAVIESSVEGATKTTVGEAIRRAEEVASIVTAKVDELVKKGVSVDTSKLDAVLAQLNDAAGKLSSLSESMSEKLSVITRFTNSAQSIMDDLNNLSKRLGELQSSITRIQGEIGGINNEIVEIRNKYEKIENDINASLKNEVDIRTAIGKLAELVTEAITKGCGSVTTQTSRTSNGIAQT